MANQGQNNNARWGMIPVLVVPFLSVAFLASFVQAADSKPETKPAAESKKAEAAKTPARALRTRALRMRLAPAGRAPTKKATDGKPAVRRVLRTARDNKPGPDEHATHEQSAIIKIAAEGEPKVKAYAFCLNKEGNLLVGCGEAPGEIRVISPEGRILNKWPLEIKPDAMNIGPDGTIYVAGSGKILKLSDSGEILLSKDAPHVSNLESSRDEIKAGILDQAKKRAITYGKMIKQRQDLIAKIEEKPEADRTELEKNQLVAHRGFIERIQKVIEDRAIGKPNEEQLAKQVEAAIQSKSAVSSISVTDDAVFVTCRMVKGFGFEVWKLTNQFEDAKQIVDNLRGCCGQMDVHARGNEIYVAENARHRMARYDVEGKLLNTWGKGDRKSVEGFGSCCNPMNVCFGPDEIVYTAESTTGRIKKYLPDGTLLSVVGRVKIVPGCKDVSIAATPDGKTVYMVDITRAQIVVMKEKDPGEAKDAAEAKQTSAPKIVPVAGLVTLDGKPLGAAAIRFVPEKGRPAVGKTDEAGRFQLTTFSEGDGAAPGTYKVQIIEGDQANEKKADARVPKKFTDAKTSALSVSVSEEGLNGLQIELASE